MRVSMIRLAVAALVALGIAGMPQASQAASGSVRLKIVKAAFVVGVQGGEGVLRFARHNYPLTVSGVSIGISAGASDARLVGTVSNIRRASDVAGVYGAAGAGLAVGGGARAIVLTNQKGAILELSGHQVGLMANADLSGLAITMK